MPISLIRVLRFVLRAIVPASFIFWVVRLIDKIADDFLGVVGLDHTVARGDKTDGKSFAEQKRVGGSHGRLVILGPDFDLDPDHCLDMNEMLSAFGMAFAIVACPILARSVTSRWLTRQTGGFCGLAHRLAPCCSSSFFTTRAAASSSVVAKSGPFSVHSSTSSTAGMKP